MEQQPASRVRTKEVILHPTSRCPLRCAHCFARSSPESSDQLTDDELLRCVDDAAHLGTVERLGISGGGDPFLRPQTLQRLLMRARELGLRTTVVTSAFWAPTVAQARRVLAPLAEAGLERLTLSHDDAHAEFVPAAKVLAACRAAVELGIAVYIAIAREPDGRVTRHSVDAWLKAEGLGDAGILVYETGINSIGRALDDATPEQQEARKAGELAYRGPCFSVLRQTSVTPDGRILPCCGTAPSEALARLAIGKVGERLDTAVRAAAEDPRLLWIAMEGPAAILRQITADLPTPLREEDFDGICAACATLYGHPEYLERMDRALEAKLPSLRFLDELFTVLDMHGGAR
jgi:hypothetical protein